MGTRGGDEHVTENKNGARTRHVAGHGAGMGRTMNVSDYDNNIQYSEIEEN